MTEVCPVCGGRGTVPPGFYGDFEYGLGTTNARETCRSCGGKGILE